MYETETETEIAALQRLIDASHSGGMSHLREIIAGEHLMSARDVVDALDGMRVLSLATVTAKGEPRVSGVDGHFLHGCGPSAPTDARPRRSTWPPDLP